MFRLYEFMKKQISYDYYCQTMAWKVCDDWVITSWHEEKKHEGRERRRKWKRKGEKNWGIKMGGGISMVKAQ
jgi:hypothetical protein